MQKSKMSTRLILSTLIVLILSGVLLLIFLSFCDSVPSKLDAEKLFTDIDNDYGGTLYLTDNGDLLCPEYNSDIAYISYADLHKGIVFSNVKSFGYDFVITNDNVLYGWKRTGQSGFFNGNRNMTKRRENVVFADSEAFIDSDGTLWAVPGVLKDQEKKYTYEAPQKLAENAVYVNTEFGSQDAYLIFWIDDQGKLYGIGDNSNRLLSDEETDIIKEPKELLPDYQFQKVIASKEAAAALTTDGKLFLWGELVYTLYMYENESTVFASGTINAPHVVKENAVDFDLCEGSLCVIDAKLKAYFTGRTIAQYNLETNEMIFEKFHDYPVADQIQKVSVGSNTLLLLNVEGKTLSFGDTGSLTGMSNLGSDAPDYRGLKEEPLMWK